MMAIHSIAVFDLGGVLIDWNPRHMYCKLFDGDDSAMEHFLATVCTPSWNEQQDAGRTFADACASLKSDTPRGAGGLVSGAASKAVVPLVEASR